MKFIKLTILYSKKLPNWTLVDFYVLACSSDNYGPILDFKVSAGSLDHKDFKTGHKMAIQGHIKATEPPKKRPKF